MTRFQRTSQNYRTGIGWQEVIAVLLGVIGAAIYFSLTKQPTNKKIIVFSLACVLSLIGTFTPSEKPTVSSSPVVQSNPISQQNFNSKEDDLGLPNKSQEEEEEEEQPKIISDERVKKGSLIFNQIKADFPNNKIDFTTWGGATDDPLITLWIPQSSWEALSGEERINLGYFIQAQMPRIRANASDYIDIPTHAPIYPHLLSKFRNLPDTSWAIGVGPIGSDGYLKYDRIVWNGG